jgi:CBS-domain-containing membrane protein
MNTRKAITIFDEDSALTLLRPYSDEHSDKLIVIHEDAYGEAVGIVTPISELRTRLNICDEEFDEILNQL